ncbi:leucine-rich repeat-containing protein 31 isoform X2 [Engraulis encrasicolus]|uniref:leucine-rich repeat-containing protein 31 isoform X2 n=1 Tax=Engraulis encrasicolus TaxID=184585 RepID=UPI002FD53E37
MESSSEVQRGSQKMSAIGLIMNQLRRKTSFTERRQKSGSFFWPGESSERRKGAEIKESDDADAKATDPGTDPTTSMDMEITSVVGWGRVKQFLEKLGKKPDSQVLSLSHCDLTATDIVELATLLPFLTQLEVVDLSWNDLVGGSLKALTFKLQHVGKLSLLRLCGCRLTAQDLEALGNGLEAVPLLELLDLSWNAGIGKANLHCLTSRFLPGCNMRELRLVDCQLTDADMTALAEGIKEMSSSLHASHGLKTLKLHMCGLEEDALSSLGDVLKFIPSLEGLDVSGNKAARGGLARVAKSLALLTHLSCLDIHLCGLTDHDADALVEVLPSLSALTELNISSNKALGDRLQALLPTLPLANMRRLLLNNCGLSTASYQALGSAMSSLVLLESLNLSWNKSVGGHLKLLLGALLSMCKLQELRLSSCDLTTEDVLHLASAAKCGALSNVKQLDLSYNGGVGDTGWAGLLAEAGGLKSLEQLDVSLRPSTPTPASPWIPNLLEALPTLPSLTHLALQHWVLRQDERDKLDNITEKKKKGFLLECDKS